MTTTLLNEKIDIKKHLSNFIFSETKNLSSSKEFSKTKIEYLQINGEKIPKFINEFWTAKQRQANSLHEISYRACFKPQLPRFFIELLTKKNDTVYDPFNGRGTTIIEASLMGRNIIANDINPLSIILSKPRLFIPDISELQKRLNEIRVDYSLKSDIDLSMFYHPKTEAEIVSLKNYLQGKKENNAEDELDLWIRMVATNRLTGHSVNFFSVYTLPPNQAISAEKQKKINEIRNQKPEYKDIKKIILKKSYDLIVDVKAEIRNQLQKITSTALFLNKDARFTDEIADSSVQLTVTSPPFLDVVQYADDNWLRCWFNGINIKEVAGIITMSKTIDEWSKIMLDVFKQLYRITKTGGYVAFEVGEVRNGKVKLDEVIVPIGLKVGFYCEGILINKQTFTKTSNIWGVKNNEKGTNTNRVVIFYSYK
ncbi:MAG: DNA methyltransferase [Bacteroidota bacterium]